MTNQTEEVVVAVREVVLEDGSVVDFGKRANVLVVTDQDNATITFNLFNGKQVVWVVDGLEGLTDFQTQVHLYGLAAKVKSSLAAIKDLDAIEVAINKQIDSINAGVFILRAGKEAVLSLTNLQKAYAIVKSSTDVAFAAWADLTAASTITDVLARWEQFDVAAKNSIRKNAYVKLELAKLDAVEAAGADLI